MKVNLQRNNEVERNGKAVEKGEKQGVVQVGEAGGTKIRKGGKGA